MTRVASLFLPQLAIERLRTGRSAAPPERTAPRPVDDNPGACSVPKGGSWRPGARWAGGAHAQTVADVAALPLHQRPPGRELGRRSEAAPPPFRDREPDGVTGRSTRVGHACRNEPVVLVASVGQRQVVTAACPAALALGIAPGMAATQARALVPGLDVRMADHAADRAVLDRLALHAARHWSPGAAATGDGLVLDLTGAAHLFGGEAKFCRRVVAFCARLGLTARIAVAGTFGAADAVVRTSTDDIVIVAPNGEAVAIAPLPVAALRLGPEAVRAASRFGFDRIGDLLPLPRAPLVRRLGLAVVERLDQALGRVAEPIVPIVPCELPSAMRRLLEPVTTVEAIATVIGDVTRDLARVLEERGLGVRAVVLIASRIDGVDLRQTVGASRPTRDAAHLASMLCRRIEHLDPGLGIEALRLVVTRAEPLAATTVAGLAGGAISDLSPTLDNLVGRAGEAALFRTRPVESDVPERAVGRTGVLEPGGNWPRWQRPVRLLARPDRLSGVVALLPDAPPRRFTWRGAPHRIVAGDGPERIHGEWWHREAEVAAVRDYYRVEDEVGARFWLFRRGDGVDPGTGDFSWWLHGLFG